MRSALRPLLELALFGHDLDTLVLPLRDVRHRVFCGGVVHCSA
jgi:hypothetical protein